MSKLRILGIVLAVIGIVATVFPEWFGPITRATEPTLDIHEAVERRVRGGMVLSFGLIFIVVTTLRPWSVSIPLSLFCFVTGALAARFYGMAIDGVTPKQWLLVAIEAILMAVAAGWLWRSS